MYENQSFYKYLPDESLEFNKEYYDLFFKLMYERQMIMKKKEFDHEPYPWTNDQFFKNYKFTNVYREYDKSTRFFIKTIILDDTLDDKNLIWKIFVYRMFNSPETFKHNRYKNGIPDINKYNPDKWYKHLHSLIDKKINPFTAAYMISSKVIDESRNLSPSEARSYWYAYYVLPEFLSKFDIIYDKITNSNPQNLLNYCCGHVHGFGPFMFYEFYTDLTYIHKFTNRKIMDYDENDFVFTGPGSKLGLRLIWPNIKNRYLDYNSKMILLRDKCQEEFDRLGVKFPYLHFDKDKREWYLDYDHPNISLKEIEMWLCEFSKYWKMMIGAGKQRSKYKVHTED